MTHQHQNTCEAGIGASHMFVTDEARRILKQAAATSNPDLRTGAHINLTNNNAIKYKQDI